MAVTVGDLIVTIGGDISKLGSALKEAEGQLQGFAGQTEAAGVGLSRLALVAGAAGAAILGALGVATAAAAEARKEQALLANAIRASGAAVDQAALERLALQLSQVTGVSDEVILSLQRQLVSFGATQREIEALTPRILDMAAAGFGLETSTRAVGLALQGSNTALVRMRVPMAKLIDLQADLDGGTRLLDKAFGGLAETTGRGLVGSLNVLRNSFNNLLEVIGAPIVTPLSQFVLALARIVDGLTALAKNSPVAVAALVVLAGAVGALLVGASGLVALGVVIPIVDKALVALAASGLTKSAVAAALLGKNMTAAAVGMRLLRVAGMAGLAVTAFEVFFALAKLANQMEVVRRISTVFIFPLLLATEIIERGFKGAVERTTAALDAMVKQQNRVVQETKKVADANEEAAKSFEEVAAAADIASLKAQQAATERARILLEQPNLSKQDLVAIEDARQARVNDAIKKRLQQRIDQNEALLSTLSKTDEKAAARRAEIEKVIEETRKELRDLALQDTRAKAEAEVEVHERLVEQRRKLEVEAARTKADLLRETLELEKEVVQAAASAEDQARQNRVEQFRNEQNLRISLLERAASIEKELGQAVLSARESLLKASTARAQAEAIRLAKIRADEVKRGVLSEAQAQELAEIEKQNLMRQTFDEELEIEKQRLEQVQRNIQIEGAVLQQKAAARLSILDAETRAQKAGLRAQQDIRIADLNATKKIAAAELTAKLAQLNAEFAATKATLERELAARQAAGLLSEKERQDRVNLLKGIEAEFNNASAAFGTAAQAKISAADEQIQILTKSFADQQVAVDKRAAVEREQIQADLTQSLISLASKDVQERSAAVARLSDLQTRAAEAGLDDVANTIDNLLRDQAAQATTQMNSLATVYEAFAKRVTAVLQPVKDLVDALANPLAANAALGKLLGAFQGLQPATAPAAGGPADVDQTFNFNFSGVNMQLTADEASLLERVIIRLLGPDGKRLFEDHINRQPKVK